MNSLSPNCFVPQPNRKELGLWGEQLATNFYIRKGYTILERNWRVGRGTEIDIIAQDRNGLIVFVEVKTRIVSSTVFGFPTAGFESVHRIKQRKIMQSAHMYQSINGTISAPSRFDVLVIMLQAQAKQGKFLGTFKSRILQVKDAFF